MKKTRTFISSLANETVGVILILAVWGGASLVYPPYIIPTPYSVVTGFGSFLPVDFGQQVLVTLYRVLAGFLLAFFVGSLIGGLAYAWKWIKPMNSLMVALQVLPGTILGVIFLLMFGIGSTTPILLVMFLTLPTMTINTVNGLANRNINLQQYLQTIHAGKRDMLHYIYFPALVPVLQSNLSLGISLAVKVVVLGEFIGSQDGLGFLLNNARILFNMKEVFFYLLVLMLFTLVFQAIQTLFFSLFLRKYTFPE